MYNMCGSYKNFKKKKFDNVNIKVLKIFVLVVIMFVVIMFLFYVFCFVFVFVDVMKVKYIWVVYNICIVLLLINSVVNLIIYFFVSDEF